MRKYLHPILLLATIYVALNFMYASTVPNMLTASYGYFAGAMLTALYAQTLANVPKAKGLLMTSSTLFFIVSFLLTLIALYSSPTNHVETRAGAIMFVSGSLLFGSSFLPNYPAVQKSSEKLLGINITLRVIFSLILLLGVLNFLVNLYNLPLTR